MASASALYTILNACYDATNHALKVVLNMIHTHQTDAQGSKLDHGAALTGLTDDDHTNYQLKSLLTTIGDTIYATAASTWARLAKGTAGALLMMGGSNIPTWLALGTASQRLSVNAEATAAEWATVTGVALSTGTYTGDNSANRAIPHGLGLTPKIVFVIRDEAAGDGSYRGFIINTLECDVASGVYTVTAMNSTNFYVSIATVNFNGNTIPYRWVALG